jgi:site-specific DNA-cytosine methylase
MRKRRIKIWLMRLLIASVFFSLFIFDVNSEVVRKVTLTGKELTFTGKRLDQLGAITFLVPDDATNPYPQLKGFARSPQLSRIDGRNHTLEGELVGSGDKPAVATNVNSNQLFIHRVTLINGKKYNVEKFDLSWLVDQLKAQADIVIDKDTIYRGGSIGSPSDYKIVVVKGSRLRLTQDFEGYGILILTDERIDNPVWDDENYIGDVDWKGRKFVVLLNEIGKLLHFKYYVLPRVRRRLRLVMEDTASWHGLIITDLGELIENGTNEDRYIFKPIHHFIERVRGKWKSEDTLIRLHRKEIEESPIQIKPPKRETPYKLLEKKQGSQTNNNFKNYEFKKETTPPNTLKNYKSKENETPDKNSTPSSNRFRRFLKLFKIKLAYAMGGKPQEKGKNSLLKKKFETLPIERKTINLEKKVKKIKVIKKPKYLPGGPLIILGRQSRRWHPIYPWPIIKLEKKVYTPCQIRRLRLLKYIKLIGRKRNIPQPGDGVSIYGAIIVSGSRSMVLMGLADVYYSQDAVDMVNQCIGSKKAFSWQQWKEAE